MTNKTEYTQRLDGKMEKWEYLPYKDNQHVKVWQITASWWPWEKQNIRVKG